MNISPDILKSQITFKPQQTGVDPFLSWAHIQIDGEEYPRGGKSVLKHRVAHPKMRSKTTVAFDKDKITILIEGTAYKSYPITQLNSLTVLILRGFAVYYPGRVSNNTITILEFPDTTYYFDTPTPLPAVILLASPIFNHTVVNDPMKLKQFGSNLSLEDMNDAIARKGYENIVKGTPLSWLATTFNPEEEPYQLMSN
ncbi:Hypothetical protein ADU72_1040 [Pediococcus damnosus]|uniref:Uncharacterized protein n=1 Tax=Pediococcus damnosus TaxID=51663 RepID=A0A0R2HJE3_9LACO|nr:hypothetical protein [Pediococcus damnosus]AMV60470.1 Hypothetical protein ADU69_0805 [Pediococcus damnosus]AMV63133.1 Hypothetical protein ADU70_1655 [Pediococcus damnosus]AMV64721.1 Hypothetical protein ADU71_0813 [Pediococcus damnosus]AMV66975.1 Hypothetical protein ADU72_1040 [Pediococcus damnosus]AMV69422.1 Hypothetical protein ADU73_1018 [Pediococcus damnosus]